MLLIILGTYFLSSENTFLFIYFVPDIVPLACLWHCRHAARDNKKEKHLNLRPQRINTDPNNKKCAL